MSSLRTYKVTLRDTRAITSDSKLNLNPNPFHSLHQIPYHTPYSQSFSTPRTILCTFRHLVEQAAVYLFVYAFITIGLGFIYTLFLIHHEMDCYFALMYVWQI